MSEREEIYQSVRAKLIGYFGESIWIDQAAGEIMDLISAPAAEPGGFV